MSVNINDYNFKYPSDCKLLNMAMNKRWNITIEQKQLLVDKLIEALTEAKNSRAKAAIGRLLATLESQNQLDDLTDEKYNRLDNGKKTEDVEIIIKLSDREPKDIDA